MGYTHYWRRAEPTPQEEWDRAIARIRPRLEAAEGLRDLKLSDQSIYFNGDCETFYVSRTARLDFDFCKTARTPYDRYVVACLLILADESHGFHWSTDGHFPQEHLDGIELAGFMPDVAPRPAR